MKDNDYSSDLLTRIEAVEGQIGNFSEYLKASYSYLAIDPQISLTKCRIFLERMLTSIYIQEMGDQPIKSMIGNLLSDKNFAQKLPPRIRARINFARDIANAGVHGGAVDYEDAEHALRDVVYTVEWYVTHYDTPVISLDKNIQTFEILPKLKEQYGDYLRPEIMSVKLGQSIDRCFLEVVTWKIGEDDTDDFYIQDEIIKRTDLSFVREGEDVLFFQPDRKVTENANRFVEDFDEYSIINCTDLFTDEAATLILKRWSDEGH